MRDGFPREWPGPAGAINANGRVVDVAGLNRSPNAGSAKPRCATSWLRREPDDVNIMLPFDEVVEAVGYAGERRIGLRVIKLDSIVGSVDRGRDFDRRSRPTSGRVRERWERLALATRRGESIPPIEVYRVGELHFIVDGHHRVSVAHALGLSTVDAYVTEVTTKLNPGGIRYRGDLIVKDYSVGTKANTGPSWT